MTNRQLFLRVNKISDVLEDFINAFIVSVNGFVEIFYFYREVCIPSPKMSTIKFIKEIAWSVCTWIRRVFEDKAR